MEDPKRAVACFKGHFKNLQQVIQHCLQSLPTSLESENLISNEVKRKAANENKDAIERTNAVLDCVASKIQTDPLYLKKFADVLKEDRYLQSMGDKLISCYNSINANLAQSGRLAKSQGDSIGMNSNYCIGQCSLICCKWKMDEGRGFGASLSENNLQVWISNKARL